MTPGSGVMVIEPSRGSTGGPYPSTTSGQQTAAAAASIRWIRSTKWSASSVGGTKMCSSPDLTSPTSAVVGIPSASSTAAVSSCRGCCSGDLGSVGSDS